MMSLRQLMKKANVARVEEISRYRLTTTTGAVHLIDFIPVEGMPGFSHRVTLDNELTGSYLGAQFKPSQHTAVDMLDVLRQKGHVKRAYVRLRAKGCEGSVLYKVTHETLNAMMVEVGIGSLRATAVLNKMTGGHWENSAGQVYFEVPE